MKRILIFTIMISTLTSFVFSQEVTRVGATSANFLKLEVGARAVSLGGAYTAVVDSA